MIAARTAVPARPGVAIERVKPSLVASARSAAAQRHDDPGGARAERDRGP
jgi:hypothetical protein